MSSVVIMYRGIVIVCGLVGHVGANCVLFTLY
jgi:hypothetical protein